MSMWWMELNSDSETREPENKFRTRGGEPGRCLNCRAEVGSSPQVLCTECSRTLYALESLERLLETFKPGEEFHLEEITAKMDESQRIEFQGMVWILDEFGLLDYRDGSCRIKSDETVNSFLIENIKLKEIMKEKGQEPGVTDRTEDHEAEEEETECPICGELKPATEFYVTGKGRECKDCAGKRNAALSLAEIRKRVEPGVKFRVDDIIESEEERVNIQGFIWELQEFDLIEEDAFKNYTLIDDSKLTEFYSKYGEGELVKDSNMVKECRICNRTLPKSSFYSTGDSTRDECRECYDKIMAWETFLSMKDVVADGPFKREDLIDSFEDPQQLDINIMILQDHDLVEETGEGFQLKHREELEEIYRIYTGAEPEPATEQASPSRKEIIHINQSTDESHNLLMNGIINRNQLMDTMEELNPFMGFMKKCMIIQKDGCFEVLIELNVKSESIHDTLSMLEEKNWENRVGLDDYMRPT